MSNKREPPRITNVRSPRLGQRYLVPHIRFDPLHQDKQRYFPIHPFSLRLRASIAAMGADETQRLWDYRFMTDGEIKLLMWDWVLKQHGPNSQETTFKFARQLFDLADPTSVRHFMVDGWIMMMFMGWTKAKKVRWMPRRLCRQIPSFPTYRLLALAQGPQPDRRGLGYLQYCRREGMLDLKGQAVQKGRCPHAGFPLKQVPVTPCGEVICPAHGLVMKDGVVVDMENL